jgi:hypothetical protein
MTKADRHKAEHWRQHVEAFRSSGLSRKAYCRKHRLNIHSLDYWRKRLKRDFGPGSPESINRFVPIRVHEDTPSDSSIKLRIGQITIEVAAGFAPEHLKNILQVLGATC